MKRIDYFWRIERPFTPFLRVCLIPHWMREVVRFPAYILHNPKNWITFAATQVVESALIVHFYTCCYRSEGWICEYLTLIIFIVFVYAEREFIFIFAWTNKIAQPITTNERDCVDLKCIIIRDRCFKYWPIKNLKPNLASYPTTERLATFGEGYKGDKVRANV